MHRSAVPLVWLVILTEADSFSPFFNLCLFLPGGMILCFVGFGFLNKALILEISFSSCLTLISSIGEDLQGNLLLLNVMGDSKFVLQLVLVLTLLLLMNSF